MSWEKITILNGKTVDLYKQDYAMSCGPSCVAMIARMFGKKAEISSAYTQVGKIDPNRPPGAHRIGITHDWERDWSFITSLTQALTVLGIRGVYTRKNLSLSRYTQFCK
jgi:hypothetical protein